MNPFSLPSSRVPARRAQAGFTIVEVVLVMAIISIIGSMMMLRASSSIKGRNDSGYRGIAATIWTAALQYRSDHAGVFPPQITPTLTSQSGAKYVAHWPENPGAATTFALTAGSPSPPDSSTALASKVTYWSNGNAATIAAYSAKGLIVYRRGVSLSTTPVLPVG